MFKQEVLLPNGKVINTASEMDAFLKENGLSLSGDYTAAYFKNVRQKKEELQRKEAFSDFINEYKKRIFNE